MGIYDRAFCVANDADYLASVEYCRLGARRMKALCREVAGVACDLRECFGYETAAIHAARCTRKEYVAKGLESIVSYDLARQAAIDRSFKLCPSGDVDNGAPDNAGSALLRIIREIRAEASGGAQ